MYENQVLIMVLTIKTSFVWKPLSVKTLLDSQPAMVRSEKKEGEHLIVYPVPAATFMTVES